MVIIKIIFVNENVNHCQFREVVLFALKECVTRMGKPTKMREIKNDNINNLFRSQRTAKQIVRTDVR